MMDPRSTKVPFGESFLADLSEVIYIDRHNILSSNLEITEHQLQCIKAVHDNFPKNVTFHILYEWNKVEDSLDILLPAVKAAGCKEEDFYRILDGTDNDQTKMKLNTITQKLNTDKLENIALKEQQCITIANYIGPECWLLGIRLGVAESYIQHMYVNERFNTQKLPYNILLEWSKKAMGETKRENNEELIRAMVKSGCDMRGVKEIFGKDRPMDMVVSPSVGIQEMVVSPSVGIQESMHPGDTNKVMGPIQTSLSQATSSNSVSSSLGYTGNLTEEYKMESDPRGLLLIINNRDFEDGSENRDGTDADCEALRILFENLGFDVYVEHNQTAVAMKRILWDLSKRSELLYSVDCLTVAILTHGSEDKLCGVDGYSCKINDLTEPFLSQFCPALHDKPKFFIVNACRGGIKDEGTPSLSHRPQDHEDYECSSDTSKWNPPSLSSIKISSMQDFLLAYSTIPGYVSWRHRKNGSWFIQVLTDVFKKQASEKYVVDMLVTVNREVAKTMNGVQIPAPSVMLTKEWYLNPIVGNRRDNL